jgi:hypothetical protein
MFRATLCLDCSTVVCSGFLIVHLYQSKGSAWARVTCRLVLQSEKFKEICLVKVACWFPIWVYWHTNHMILVGCLQVQTCPMIWWLVIVSCLNVKIMYSSETDCQLLKLICVCMTPSTRAAFDSVEVYVNMHSVVYMRLSINKDILQSFYLIGLAWAGWPSSSM